MGIRLTASALQVAKECVWPFRTTMDLPKTSSDEANFGTTMHDICACIVEGRVGDYAKKFAELKGEDYYKVADHIRAVEEFWRGRPRGQAELSFAWDMSSRKARILGSHLNREYKVDALEIAGTTDYVIEHESMLLVGDWKSGWADHVEPVSSNQQLRFLGLCAARAYDRQEVSIEIAYVKPGKVWAETCVLDSLELMAIEEELLELMSPARAATATPGGHCQFCPGQGKCPATVEMMSALHPGINWSANIESDEHAAGMAMNIGALKKSVDAIYDALKDRVRANGPLPLPDGRVYRIVTQKRQSLDMTAIKNFLGDKLPQFQSELEIETFRAVKR